MEIDRVFLGVFVMPLDSVVADLPATHNEIFNNKAFQSRDELQFNLMNDAKRVKTAFQ